GSMAARRASGVVDERLDAVAVEAFQEGDEIADLLLAESERADGRVLRGVARAAAIVVAHDVGQRLERSVVHIRRRARDVAQTRRLEFAQVAGLMRHLLAAAVLEDPSGRQRPKADAGIVESVVREQRGLRADGVTCQAAGLAGKQAKSLLRSGTHCPA